MATSLRHYFKVRKRMSKIIDVYGKKLFSLALIFNALLTVAFAVGILGGFYTLYPLWKPYPPYIIDGSIFWILIPAAVINIFPCVNIGKVHTGRLWFHHYVYGFIVMGVSIAALALSIPVSLMLNLFTGYITDTNINIGRFFILGGLTLVIDDLPDVSNGLKSSLSFLKSKAHKHSEVIHAVQVVMVFVSLYFLTAISLYLLQNPPEVTLANSILVGTLLTTTATSIANSKRRAWLNIKLEKTKTTKNVSDTA